MHPSDKKDLPPSEPLGTLSYSVGSLALWGSLWLAVAPGLSGFLILWALWLSLALQLRASRLLDPFLIHWGRRCTPPPRNLTTA